MPVKDDIREIPLIDLGQAGPVSLIDAVPERLQEIFDISRQHYGGLALRQGDRATRRWLARNANPYQHEIAEIARRVNHPGAYMLNLSFEWSCTAGIGPDPAGDGSRLLRSLDWPLNGLGRNVVVTWQENANGAYFNVTWPGFVGILTAMAPGRFSAAINQPPMRRHTRSCWFDWAINRYGVWRRTGYPPPHLLRKVFDECSTYEEAKTMLVETPLCIPAFFSLSGLNPDQGCVIERLENKAAVLESPASIANHWLHIQMPGRDRGLDSRGRLKMMEEIRGRPWRNFDWVKPPILNPTTRLSVIANAQKGALSVLGWEVEKAATAPFHL